MHPCRAKPQPSLLTTIKMKQEEPRPADDVLEKDKDNDKDIISDPESHDESEEDEAEYESKDDEEDNNVSRDEQPQTTMTTKRSRTILTRSKSSALAEFRGRVEEAIRTNSLMILGDDNNKKNDVNSCVTDVPCAHVRNYEDIKLWGVPLLPSAGHEGTDVVLIKFLKAKRYKVHKAFGLLQQTLKWRANILQQLEDNNNNNNNNNNNSCNSNGNSNSNSSRAHEMDCVSFSHGRDKEGRLLFYTAVGKEFRKKLRNTESDYFRWRIEWVEKGIERLDFRGASSGVDSFIQIIDFKNSPGIVNREIKLTYKKMLTLLKERYPGIVYRTLAINVPSWFLALNALNLRYIAQRGNNRFMFVKPHKVTETLLKYATIENILVQYGGLSRENDTEFGIKDKVVESEIKPNSSGQILIPASEADTRMTWDMTVVGYDVMYREEFIPDDDCSYTVLLQEKRMGDTTRNSFYIREPGNIVITISNATYYKKKAFYRYKTTPVVPPALYTSSYTTTTTSPASSSSY